MIQNFIADSNMPFVQNVPYIMVNQHSTMAKEIIIIIKNKQVWKPFNKECQKDIRTKINSSIGKKLLISYIPNVIKTTRTLA